MIKCRCGKEWSGTSTAHCGVCHHTFSGVTGFDAHRRGGTCLPPAEAGLVQLDGRKYECFGSPRVEATSATPDQDPSAPGTHDPVVVR